MSGVLDGRESMSQTHARERSSGLDVVGERAAAVGVGLLIVSGFASSYTTLRDLAVEVGGFSPWLAPVVPLSFDLGIVVLSLKVVLAARAGRDARVLRALVLALSAATVVTNGAASSTAVGRLMHAVPPAMFVVCFETLAASARHDARTRRAASRIGASRGMEAAPALVGVRLLLAPRQTWSVWRAHVLAMDGPVAVSPISLTHPPASIAPPAPAAPRGPTAEAGHAPEVRPVSGRATTAHDRPSSQPLSSTHRDVTGDRPDSRTVGHPDRLEVAVEALRADRTLTAVALVEHLKGAGHPVSVRTAQRVRDLARQHVDPGADASGALSASVRPG